MRPTVVITLIVASLAGLLAFATHTLVPDAGPIASFFDYRVYYALMLAAVVLCGLRAVSIPDDRVAWTCITAGIAAYAAGDIYWEAALASLDEVPYPSLADAAYLAYFPAVYAGLVLLFRPRLRATRAIWIDGATAALAVAAVSAAVLVEIVLDSTGGSIAAVATNLAYPAGDILLLAIIIGALAVGGARIGRSALLLTGALAFGSVADSIYLFQAARGTYTAGTFLDALWPASMLCIAYAAWSDLSPPPRVREHTRPLLLVPMACGLAATIVLVAQSSFAINSVAVVLAAAALGGVLVRLVLTFRENQHLLELTHSEAITDQLTGLSNRRKLLRDLDAACTSLDRGGGWLLALFDLDGFKFYNDTFGHPAGDALLVRLGRRLDEACRAAGSVYRLGGDEFCLLTQAPDAEAAALLDAAIAALSDHGKGFSVTSSFGAVFLPDEARDPSGALRLADSRLYVQKYGRQARRDRAHEALVQALYERDPAIEGHLRRVVELSRAVGKEFRMSPTDLEQLERAALLHDIGKLAVPDDLLRKPGPLTPEEFVFIRQHTLVGERILAAAPALRGVGAIVRSSHERWDGAGYPDGLVAKEIPLAARVIAACDAYTAMCEQRPYCAERTEEDALAELRRCAGTRFDPAVVEVLTGVLAAKHAGELESER